MKYLPQSTRVAMATFWCTYYHDGKNSPDWCTPSPFHYIFHHVQSCGVPYVPAKGGRYTHPLFLLYPFMYSAVSPQSSCSTYSSVCPFYFCHRISQCCRFRFGSVGSVTFWTTRIRHSPLFVYGSGSFHHPAKKKTRKTLIFTIF
jgi:hypothetical protein